MNQLKALFRKAVLLSTIPFCVGTGFGNGLDENFHMLDQWVEVEKTISKERNDWEVEKRGLQDVIKVYEQELKLLVEKIEEAKEFTSAADSKRSEMLEAQDELRKIEAKLESVVAAQEARLLRIIERIPAPLRDEIAPLTRRIPLDASATTLSISQRLQSIVGVLTQVDKFNTAVEIVPEQREFEGNRVQVTTIYFGLGAAYYADRSGEHAGYGRSTEKGWQWVPDASIAADVLRLIDMYEGNTTQIEFVPMPVNINN